MPKEIGGIPRYRTTALPPLFSQGFRPFFLAAGLSAPILMLLWILEICGRIEVPTAFSPPVWHAHETLFGFAVAAMAGFLMTAIPNWSGRMPLQGMPLLGLVAIWIAGRLASATSSIMGTLPAGIIDLSFLLSLILVFGREVLLGRNWRNWPMIAALFLLLLANGLIHLAAAGIIAEGALGIRGAIGVMATMIGLVGGRVIPSFTRNRLARARVQQLPGAFGWIDRAAIALVPASLLMWTISLPIADVTGWMLALAGAATLLRLLRWRGWKILKDPILLMLHLGYAWLGLGLLLVGASEITIDVPTVAGLHALGVGAVGSSILGVMARATLDQTGRRSSSVAGTTAILITMAAAAIFRIIAVFANDSGLPLTALSGVFWIATFGLFILLFGRPLICQRIRPISSNKSIGPTPRPG